MSLFAIKNDEGKYLHIPEAFCDHDWDTRADTWDDREVAKDVTHHHGGHVVELVEKPALIVVSEAEAKMLEQAKDDYCAASVISAYSTEHIGAMGQDRLMHAYVNGYTVKNQKRYFVRVPHANRHYYYQKCDSGEVIPVWDMETEPPTQFTLEEIEQYGLQDCEKTEVPNED